MKKKILIIIGLNIILIYDIYYIIMSVQHFCPSCGSKTNPNSEFCEVCGLELFSNKHEDNKSQESNTSQVNIEIIRTKDMVL